MATTFRIPGQGQPFVRMKEWLRARPWECLVVSGLRKAKATRTSELGIEQLQDAVRCCRWS